MVIDVDNDTVLCMNQYGDKQLVKDARINSLLDAYGYNSAKPMFCDLKSGGSKKVGYVLTCRGCEALWINVFSIKEFEFVVN